MAATLVAESGCWMPGAKPMILVGRIEQRILLVRGEKVLIDADLAARGESQTASRPDRFGQLFVAEPRTTPGIPAVRRLEHGKHAFTQFLTKNLSTWLAEHFRHGLLAEFYGVATKRFNEQVKRNGRRFPKDFVFKLTASEKAEVVASCDHLANLKYAKGLPNAFTEHGALMAASILSSCA